MKVSCLFTSALFSTVLSKPFFSAVFFSTVFASVTASAQNRVEEVRIKQEPKITSTSQITATETHSGSEYASNLKMREERRIGLGSQIGGGLGLAGLAMELNLDPENSALTGVGGGPGYGSFQLLWRHSFEGPYFTPYTTAGWSRWYNSDSESKYRSSSILDRVLTAEQKSTGRFGVDFLTVSAGMQYQQLSGDFSGLSFFAEFALMSAFQNFTLLPTGSLGAIYYF